MTISLIAAVADNRAIGRDGDMPWHISEDLKFFKRTTMNGAVIMGRRTWESIGAKPLKGRLNIVVSKTQPKSEGMEVAPSMETALSLAKDYEEVFVMGGGQLYAAAMPVAQRLYITHVHTEIEDADTLFPEIDLSWWHKVSESGPFTDEASGYEYEFVTYERWSLRGNQTVNINQTTNNCES